jgi:hypothetical protein
MLFFDSERPCSGAIALHGRRSPYPLTHDEREAKVRRRAGRLAGAGNCERDSSALYSGESASVLARVQRRVRGDQTPRQEINQIEPDSHVETPVESVMPLCGTHKA